MKDQAAIIEAEYNQSLSKGHLKPTEMIYSPAENEGNTDRHM